jgi:2-C-methyl-D-erythritol 4-phosphate cytidylyltransferase
MEKALAIITAAGSSSRFGCGNKKEYRRLGNSTVLRRCLDAFLETGIFTTIMITLPPGHDRQAAEALGLPGLGGPGEDAVSLSSTCSLRFVTGGETRQISVFNALEQALVISPAVVLIHDGARPWITKELISEVFRGTVDNGACLPVVQASDAVKVLDQEGFIQEQLDRNTIYAAQTPQGFRYPKILEGHRRAAVEGHLCVDDTEIYHRYMGRVFTVPGDPANKKITFPMDIETTAEGRNE